MKKLIILLVAALLGMVAFSASTSARPKARTETVTYVVSMHCQNCVNKIMDKVSFMKGVEDLKISLKDKTVTIKYNPDKVQEPTLRETLENLGYTVTRQEPQPAEK